MTRSQHGLHRATQSESRGSGGAAGNERLTAMTGAALLVLLAAEGVTILSLRQLITPHFFIGMLLLGPVALKAGSTIYRFTRYYTGSAPYRRKGPPAPLLRLLGPVVIASTAGVFGTGIALAVTGPAGRQPWLFLHKASFVIWFCAMTIHVLAYLPRLPRLLASEARGEAAAETGLPAPRARPRLRRPGDRRARRQGPAAGIARRIPGRGPGDCRAHRSPGGALAPWRGAVAAIVPHPAQSRVACVADSAHCCLMAINWTQLRAAAVDVASRAYSPYSRLRVGAAGLTGDGRVVTGCNVENASYGLTLCAECGLVSALHATRQAATDGAVPPVLIAVAVVAGDGDPLLPCGRCRQLLLEAGGPELLVDTASGPVALAHLLPASFGTADLAARRDQPAPPPPPNHGSQL